MSAPQVDVCIPTPERPVDKAPPARQQWPRPMPAFAMAVAWSADLAGLCLRGRPAPLRHRAAAAAAPLWLLPSRRGPLPIAPGPTRPGEQDFLLPVEGTHSIAGRGTVVTGRVESGQIKIGDELEIVGIKPTTKTTCTLASRME